MVAFIDAHRTEYGVESICRQLPIAPATYYEYKAREADPERLPPRTRRDNALLPQIRRVMGRTLPGLRCSEGLAAAEPRADPGGPLHGGTPDGRDGFAGRGKAYKTTIPDTTAERPADLVQRQFQAASPTQLWVAGFTYVATRAGVVFVAFVIDVFAGCIVGWRVASSMRTDLVLDALEKALWLRTGTESLVHHSDRSSQYLSIRYSECLAEAGIELSCCRVRHAVMGRQIQSPPAAGTDRQHTTGGVGTVVLSPTGRVSHRGLIQTNGSPEYPGRFTEQAGDKPSSRNPTCQA